MFYPLQKFQVALDGVLVGWNDASFSVVIYTIKFY